MALIEGIGGGGLWRCFGGGRGQEHGHSLNGGRWERIEGRGGEGKEARSMDTA